MNNLPSVLLTVSECCFSLQQIFLSFTLGVATYDPMKASSYIPLPKVIANRQACLNIKNVNDDKCFLWCVLASLHPVTHGQHSNRVSKYQPYEGELNMDGISYPVSIRDVDRFERQNQVSISVYGLDEDSEKVFPIRITEISNAIHHVDLLYISKEDNGHYVLIKDLERLVSTQVSKRRARSYICRLCLHACSSKEILDCHTEKCQLHNAQRIKMPSEEEKLLSFNKIEAQTRLPFVMYADFDRVSFAGVKRFMK